MPDSFFTVSLGSTIRTTHLRHRKQMHQTLFAIAMLLVAASSVQAKVYCYTVLDSTGKVISRSTNSQVDLSRNISDEMAAKYPRHHFMFGLEEDCTDISTAREADSSSAVRDSNQAAIANLVRRYDITSMGSDSAYSSSANWYGSPRSVGKSGTPGTGVQVRSYTRADGMQVPAHTRSAPGRGR